MPVPESVSLHNGSSVVKCFKPPLSADPVESYRGAMALALTNSEVAHMPIGTTVPLYHGMPCYPPPIPAGYPVLPIVYVKNNQSQHGPRNNRFYRRNSNPKRNRHNTAPSHYQCNSCCYGYPAESNPRNRNVRNRSYSGDSANSKANVIPNIRECAYLYSNYRKRSSLYNLTDDEYCVIQIGARSFNLRDPRYDVLTFDQVRCLFGVLEQTIKIRTDLHVDLIEFSLMHLILAVRNRLLQKNIVLYDIRLNGGAASHVLSPVSSVYNDIDLIFSADLTTVDQFERVREAVLEVLLELMPAPVCERRRLIETFVNKMVKIQDVDNWSLISLVNYGGRNVELKFVGSMRRQYEFSVDSFQIVLDTFLQFCVINAKSNPMTYNFYPTVVGESMFGNFSEAMFHLHHRLIVTKTPEEIRGGGLLKYCSLLVRNFYPPNETSAKVLEPYMSTRFFIDFYYYDTQQDRVKNYLIGHFGNDSVLKYNFMIIFFNILRRSSSLAVHHAAAMVEFERITMECYGTLLLDYLNLYLTDYSKVQEFFTRCQEIRVCHCPRYFRSCIHRYLNQVYQMTLPIIVTYVDDPIDETVSRDKRRRNLAKFGERHDELFPLHGGFCFALLPSCLFDCAESNHYVVSSSSLSMIPSARFVKPQMSNPACSFVMKPTTSADGKQTTFQLIPLGIPNLLPQSFYPIDCTNQNLITPALAFHFFPPIAPPPSHRLCIVNRIPLAYSEPIESGPIFHSQIVAMHYSQSSLVTPGGESGPVKMNKVHSSPVPGHIHQAHAHAHAHHHHHHSHLHHHHSVDGQGHVHDHHSIHCVNGARSHHMPIRSQSVPIEPLRIIFPSMSPNMDIMEASSVNPQPALDRQLCIPQIAINGKQLDLDKSNLNAPPDSDSDSNLSQYVESDNFYDCQEELHSY